MAEPERQPPFYERRWFQGAGAVVALVAGVWALVGAPRPWDVASRTLDASAQVALVNTEIVLDSSAAMAEPFDRDTTKLEAAVRAIGSYVAPLSSNGLALRSARGGCGSDGELVAGFAADNGENVHERALEQRPGGQTNVIAAVRAAIAELSSARFVGPASTRRVMVFMGGPDECAFDAAAEIRDDIKGTGVNAVFRLVALGVPGSEMHAMRSFKRSLEPYADIEIKRAETDEELDRVMEEERREAAEAEEAVAPTGVRSLVGPGAQPSREPGHEGAAATMSRANREPEPEPEPEPKPEPEPEPEPVQEVEPPAEEGGEEGLSPSAEADGTASPAPP